MTVAQLKALVSKGKKLAKKVAALERLKTELDEIKAQLREVAGKKSVEIAGRNGDLAFVKQHADTVARTVPAHLQERVTALAGEHLLDLFNLAPAKGDQASFELNAHKVLGLNGALLVKELRVPSSARVSFE